MDNIYASDIANAIKYSDFNDSIEKIKNNNDWLNHSCVVVVDDDKKIFGVITEANILIAEKEQKNTKATHAWEICSHKLLSVSKGASINDVITLMLNNHVHHILVNDIEINGKECNGIISTLDILKLIHNKDLLH